MAAATPARGCVEVVEIKSKKEGEEVVKGRQRDRW